MEKLCLGQLRLQQHRDDVRNAAGTNSRALFVKVVSKKSAALC